MMIGMRWLVGRVNAKKSPNIIPLAGNKEKLDLRDYYSLELQPAGKAPPLLFVRVRGSFVAAREWDASTRSYQKMRAVRMDGVSALQPYVRYYYRTHEFQFEKPWKLWIFTAMHMHRVIFAINTAAQIFYNRKALATVARTDLMIYIAARYMSDSKYVPNQFERLGDRYGKRVLLHPDFQSIAKRERVLLDSLVQTGELNQVNGQYLVMPALFTTLDKLAIEERRHSQGITVQRVLIAIAAATLFAAAVQAWAAWASLQRPSPSPAPALHNA